MRSLYGCPIAGKLVWRGLGEWLLPRPLMTLKTRSGEQKTPSRIDKKLQIIGIRSLSYEIQALPIKNCRRYQLKNRDTGDAAQWNFALEIKTRQFNLGEYILRTGMQWRYKVSTADSLHILFSSVVSAHWERAA